MAPDKTSHEIYERVASLEARFEEHRDNDGRRFDKIEEVLQKITALEKSLTEYRGMLGGGILVFSVIVVFLKLFSANVREWLSSI